MTSLEKMTCFFFSSKTVKWTTGMGWHSLVFSVVKGTLTNVYKVKSWSVQLVLSDLIFSPVSCRLENRFALLI